MRVDGINPVSVYGGVYAVNPAQANAPQGIGGSLPAQQGQSVGAADSVGRTGMVQSVSVDMGQASVQQVRMEQVIQKIIHLQLMMALLNALQGGSKKKKNDNIFAQMLTMMLTMQIISMIQQNMEAYQATSQNMRVEMSQSFLSEVSLNPRQAEIFESSLLGFEGIVMDTITNAPTAPLETYGADGSLSVAAPSGGGLVDASA